MAGGHREQLQALGHVTKSPMSQSRKDMEAVQTQETHPVHPHGTGHHTPSLVLSLHQRKEVSITPF